MDDSKVKGSVKNETRFKEVLKKEEVIRINWPNNWQWWIDLFREREKAVADYKKSSPKALALGERAEKDKRTTRPFPETTQREYGWLSSKKDFQLEKFGGYYTKIPLEQPPAPLH